MKKEALDILLEKYTKGTCSEEEKAFLNTLLDAYAKANQGKYIENEAIRTEILHRIYEDIQNKIQRDTNSHSADVNGRTPVEMPFEESTDQYPGYKGKITELFKWRFLRYAAAAVLCIGVGLYLLTRQNSGIIADEIAFTAKSSFVNPGNTSASILLGDGKKVALDSTLAAKISKIQVTEQGVFLIDKNGGKTELSKRVNSNAGLHVFSSLITERGQQAPEMTLADGTKVWLNAASELRFPVQFSGSLREVQLSGEAYFEVAHDLNHPFIVHMGTTAIRVLGTHFNVMAYTEEENISATLLEGSIQLTRGSQKALLAPGQQGVVDAKGKINVKKVNTSQAVAWMHGKLPMDNMEVHAFLREVSRWYDVDIQYLDAIPSQTFSGNLNRQVPLKNILDALKVNGVNAYLENRTIVVSQ